MPSRYLHVMSRHVLLPSRPALGFYSRFGPRLGREPPRPVQCNAVQPHRQILVTAAARPYTTPLHHQLTPTLRHHRHRLPVASQPQIFRSGNFFLSCSVSFSSRCPESFPWLREPKETPAAKLLSFAQPKDFLSYFFFLGR